LKLSSTRLAYTLSHLALSKKASDIHMLDVRRLTEMTDYFVICTANADLHGRAIADGLSEEMEKKKIRPLHREGYQQGRWILLDFVDVVVHIFLKEAREFYNLENLWGDAPCKVLSHNGRFRVYNGQVKLKRPRKK
jgi:ribosome-associated protein